MSYKSELYTLPECRNELALYRTAYGMLEKPIVCKALENKLFDMINEEGPMSMEELIKRCGFPNRGGRIVIDLVTALDYLKCIDGRYHLTELSKTYFVKTQFDWGYAIKYTYFPVKQFDDAWEKDVRGEIKADTFTESWLENFLVSKELAQDFTKFMECVSLPRAISFAKSLDLNKTFGIKAILDVAGGSACFSRALAANQKNMRAIVVELPKVCEVANEYIQKSNLPEDAVLTYPCNMFKEPFPDCNDPKYGYQAIFMSNILHDWDDKTCRFLCKKAYDALPFGGTILIHEALLNEDGNGPLISALISAYLFVVTRGKNFKFSEIKELLTEAGFADVGFIVTYAPYATIYAKKT